MSIAERYIRATGSAHLEWKITTGDVDHLVAAGLVREGIATRLIRLRSEYDGINKASLREANTPLTARLLTLTQLSSLALTKQYLGEYAQQEAAARNPELSFKEVAEITGKVLELFLDPNCDVCDGKGFTGIYGSPQIRCKACRETGKRQPRWKNDAHEHFGRWLQSEIEEKTSRALGYMQKLLRAR